MNFGFVEIRDSKWISLWLFYHSFVLSFYFFVVQLLLHGIQLHNNITKKKKFVHGRERYGNRFSFSDQGDVAWRKHDIGILEQLHVLLVTSPWSHCDF